MKFIYGLMHHDFVLLGTATNTLAAMILKRKYRKLDFDNIIITDSKIQETTTSKIIIL